LAATLWACQSPPGGIHGDGGASFADASAVDDAATVDAADADANIAADAGVDAAVIDAASVDAATADASPPADANSIDANLGNPLDIELTEVTSQVGNIEAGFSALDTWASGRGAAVGDVDGDGDLDVVLARCEAPTTAQSLLLVQTGTVPTFDKLESSVAFEALFAGTCAFAPALGDYDGDGDLDLFMAMSGSDILLQNDGAGNFTDATFLAGVAGPGQSSSTGAIWADLNSDGLLDLYVLAHAAGTASPTPGPENANRLYMNEGDGTFREVAVASGAAGEGHTQATLISDLDNDGELELYIANDQFSIDGGSTGVTLQHDLFLDAASFDDSGTPSYTDKSTTYGMSGLRSAMGVALADLNGDGIDDIYVSDWGKNHLHMWNTTSSNYDEVADAWSLDQRFNPLGIYNISWGARFVDLDRDGSEELILINGQTTLPTNCASWSQLDLYLRRSDTSDTFVNITPVMGWPYNFDCVFQDITYSGRGVAMGDLDNDGDDDVIVTPYAEKFRFHRNDSSTIGRHWVRVRPASTVSAPTPIGLVLRVELAGGKVVRRRLYGGGDPRSQSDHVLEVGLGSETSVVRATLEWPSGFVQRIDQLPGFATDTTLVISEPAWLNLTTRVMAAAGVTPKLGFIARAEDGTSLGAAGAGKTVTATRSDGLPVTFVDLGNGNYQADLPHPGVARITVFTVTVDGVTQRHRPTIKYRM